MSSHFRSISRLLLLVIVVLLVLLVGVLSSAAQDTTAKQLGSPRPKFSYWHNWTDRNGVSHMTKCPVTSFDLKSMSPPAGPQWQARQPQSGAQVIFTQQPAHWNGAWHEDPMVQWIVPLKGSWFVEAMDGTRVTLGPGDVSLGEDQNTRPDAQGHKGHLARNVGSGPVTLMVIQLDEPPTINQPCRFK
jgi:hypothetical protein